MRPAALRLRVGTSTLRRARSGAPMVIALLVFGCSVASRPAPPPAPVVQDDPARFRLLLRLGERKLYLLDGESGATLGQFPIAVGRKGLETPTGQFQVEELVVQPEYPRWDKTRVPPQIVATVPPGPDNPLGERWIGFAHGDGWTVGIHGTPHPELLGQAVSHGCVRMRNADVIRVYEHVRLGTPVTVVP